MSLPRTTQPCAGSGIVDELQDVACKAQVIELPECLFRLVLALVARELAHDGGLRDLLLPERGHDPLDGGPFTDDQLVIGFARGFDEPLTVVPRCMTANEAGKFAVEEVAIARRELQSPGAAVYATYMNIFEPATWNMTRTASHKWVFVARFRRGAFGWKSALPIQRLKEALTEIRQIARADPALAAEGAVVLLERLSPALEHVDSSSGAIGTAVNRAIDCGSSRAVTGSGMSVTERGTSSQAVGSPRRSVKRLVSASSMRFCPYRRLSRLEALIPITALSRTFEPLREVSTCRLARRMLCRAATSFSGRDCWAPDFMDALTFADADFDEGTVAVFAAAGLLCATACGEPPAVLFDISDSLGNRSVGVGW